VSSRIKLALAGIGIFAFALVIFFLVLNPIRGDISELEEKIEEEEGKISKAKIELAAAETTRNDGRRNQARLLELAKMVPEDPEIPSLVLQIHDLSSKAGIEWIQVSPGKPQAVEGAAYQIVAVSVTFTGTFFDVNDFMYRAEQMVAGPGRLLTVKNVSLAPEGSTGSGSTTKSPELSVRMTIYAFSLPAAAAQTPAPAGGAGEETTTTTEPSQ